MPHAPCAPSPRVPVARGPVPVPVQCVPARVGPPARGLDETLTLISLDSDQLLTDVREHPASGAPGYRSGVFVRCPVVLAARAAVGVSRVNASS